MNADHKTAFIIILIIQHCILFSGLSNDSHIYIADKKYKLLKTSMTQ
jgi:hypothetical protein